MGGRTYCFGDEVEHERAALTCPASLDVGRIAEEYGTMWPTHLAG